VIPGPHRTKGGSPLIGAAHGQPGPFGTWTDDEVEDQHPDELDPGEPIGRTAADSPSIS